MDLIIALLQSKRVWMFAAALIVAMGQLLGVTLDPNRVLGILMLFAAMIHGESIRPIARKNRTQLSTPRIFPPVAGMLCIGLLLSVGCCGPSTKPTPTPAPEPLTSIETATELQLRSVASGYADAYAKVAAEIRSGSIKSTQEMRDRLVPLTRDVRLSAEYPVLDEMDAHFPQGEAGEWPDSGAVATYLEKLATGYQRVHGRLSK